MAGGAIDLDEVTPTKPPPGGKMRLPSHETGFDLAASLHPARYCDNAPLTGKAPYKSASNLIFGGESHRTVGDVTNLSGPHSPRPTSTTISLAGAADSRDDAGAEGDRQGWHSGLFAIGGSSIGTRTNYSAANDGNNYSATV
jgi:hypothetical protein